MTDAQYLAWLKSASARRCVLVEAIARIGGVETTLYLSNLSYVSDAAGTPASTAYTACIEGGVTFSQSLDLTNSGDGLASMSTGDIEIVNRGGIRDNWLTYIWANRQVKVYMGDAQWVRSDFRLIFDGVVEDIDSRNSEVLNLRLRDKMERLNNPMTENVLGGSSDNKDRLVPLTFGECFNVSPLLTDPALLQYKFHDTSFEGQAERVIEVRSNGAVPVNTTVSLANGRFTLNVAPAGTDITASVQGGRNASNVYSNDASNLVQRIVTKYGPSATRFSTSDLDTTSLSAFATANPQPLGLYAADRMNMVDACQQLASSIGAQMYLTSTGKLRLVKVALPSTQSTVLGSAWPITADDILYHSLEIDSRPPVVAAVKLGYCKNWTPQNNLAAGVNPISVPLFQQEWMTVTASDATVATNYKATLQPEQQDTLLLAESDANAEAVRRRDLWKVPRTVFKMECRAHYMLVELGDPVTLTHDRFNLSGGVSGMVVSLERDWLKGRVTLGVLA